MKMKRSAMVLAAAMAAAACSSGSNGATGSTSQSLAVGSPCTGDAMCGSAPFFCMQGDHPGGYCMRDCDIQNGDADCPGEAICQFDGTKGECHKKCGGAADCRTGYVCSPASHASDDMASGSFCDAAGTAMDDGGMDGMSKGD